MNALLAQSDASHTAHRLVFVGGLWPVFWAVVAATALGAVLWLVIVDGMIRRRFGLGLVLRAVACLWVGIIAAALATVRADVGSVGVVIVGLAALGMVLYLYAAERRYVSRSMGLTLTGLRLLLIVVLFAMMAEPIVSLNQSETKKRCLAVLADESVSMDVVDRHMTAGQRLRLADALGELSELARPIRLEADAIELRWIARQLGPQGEWLTDVLRDRQRRDEPTSSTDKRRQTMHASLEQLTQRAEAVREVLDTVLEDRQTIPRDSVGDLVDLRSRLTSQAIEPLKELLKAVGDRRQFEGLAPEQIRRLMQMHEDAVRGVATAADSLSEAGERLDEAFARRADAEARDAMDNAGEVSRRQIVGRLLGGGRHGLVGQLSDDVNVRYYLFADRPRAAGLDQVTAEVQDRRDSTPAVIASTTRPTTTAAVATTTQPTGADTDRALTNLAEALEQVSRDLPTEQLAGVIVLSDGQHNASGDPVRVAQTLGSQNVGVYPVVVGAREAPTDAAIVKVDVANVVHVDDTMDVSVSVRADGLGGKVLKVRLLDDAGRVLDLEDVDEQGRPVSRDTPLKEKTLTIATDHEGHEVRLSHKPKGKGRHVHRVVLDTLPEEVFTENNEQVFAVDVTDERTKVLIVDGLPRWEFRYLRNLLVRDDSVRLQHVLFDPALIARQPEMKLVTARVTNETPEADRLPDEAEELNAFDVIVLGDVGPDDLPRDKQQMLERFVSDRGGALVVVAGKRHMPVDYEAQPLAVVLPVQFGRRGGSASTRPVAGLALAAAFHLRPTSEGLHHMVTELAVEPETNQALWTALPAMYWRSPIRTAKGGSSVLAWARGVAGGDSQSGNPSTRRGNGDAEVDVHRQNAMLVAQNYGLGKVLYIGWDATWRFRYKYGDKYHHKFWGQVLRWATAGKLPAGLKLVKVGTDKARYNEGDPVLVRAKFTRPDFTPMTDAEVRAVVHQGEKTITSVRMAYVSGSPGMYEASVTGLPRGKFSVSLDSPQIDQLRQRDDPPGEVGTTIVVDAAQSAERLALAANGQLMAQLAEASGGVEIAPTASDRLARHVAVDPVVKHVHQQVTIWDKWWLLVLFAGIVGVEWILRKRAGLM